MEQMNKSLEKMHQSDWLNQAVIVDVVAIVTAWLVRSPQQFPLVSVHSAFYCFLQ